ATVSPSLAMISPSVPAEGAGTSMVTLSVSSSTNGSSTATASPAFLNHFPMVASVTDSPSVGTRISVMVYPSCGRLAGSQSQPGLQQFLVRNADEHFVLVRAHPKQRPLVGADRDLILGRAGILLDLLHVAVDRGVESLAEFALVLDVAAEADRDRRYRDDAKAGLQAGLVEHRHDGIDLGILGADDQHTADLGLEAAGVALALVVAVTLQFLKPEIDLRDLLRLGEVLFDIFERKSEISRLCSRDAEHRGCNEGACMTPAH